MSILYKDTNGNIHTVDGSQTQFSVLPTPSADLVGKIYQYIGDTALTYTNGWFYKCVSGSTAGTYEWTPIEVQSGGGGTQIQSDWGQTDTEADDYIKNKPTLGSASAKDVATSGDASATQVVMGNDSRLTDARNAADVSAWAKAGTKPTYTASEVGLGNVVNTGDSATPVANGTTKFTTGGAYTELNKKVDKEEGKGLSSNDFTDDDKTAILNSAIPSTSTASPLTDSSNGMLQGLTVYGRSEVVDGEIKSVGDDGLTVTTANSDNTLTTSATFTTALPLRGVSDTVRDKRIFTAESKQVEKVCGVVDLGDLEWNISSGLFYAPVPQIETKTDSSITVSVLCSKYNYNSDGFSQLQDKQITSQWIALNIGGVYVKDTDYASTSDFKTAVTGVKLVYPLATPVTTPLTTTEISAFRGLRTYDNTTNVTITDSPDFELDYLKNSGNGQAVADIQTDLQEQIDGLKSKIEKNHFCYSYKIDLSDSNPATCVKPHFDTRYGCDNFSFTSAKMNYTTGVFDYGSWEGFIRRIARPCMLKYDGTVDYYLDPDDYSKKITGEASDVADVNYQGNAMVELEKLYFKRYTYNGIQYCFIADRKLDKSFKCYAHHDKYGKELDYIYRACYDGMYDGTRLRSISGVDYHNLNALTVNKIMSNTTRTEEIAFAQANNVASEQGEGWYILHKSEWDYINDILFLIGMSTDVQTTFGRGRDSGYVSATDTGIISTGTMDDKGLFWGKNDGSAGVKVLGIENHWANLYKSMAGYINASGTQKIKQTYGTEDGSTVVGFNTDGTGYVAIVGATPTKGDSLASGGGYITAWKYNDYGLIPYECTSAGSSAKFIPDYFYFNNNQTNFALVGGDPNVSLGCGLFVYLNIVAGYRDWFIGAALSYKPLSAA